MPPLERSDRSATDCESHRSTPTKGVPQVTWEFIKDAQYWNAFAQLEPLQRNAIGVYFGSNASLENIRKLSGRPSRESAKWLLKSSMYEAWQYLPLPYRQKHEPKEVIQMKERNHHPVKAKTILEGEIVFLPKKPHHTAEGIKSLREQLIGKPSRFKGRQHTEEARQKMRKPHSYPKNRRSLRAA